MKWFNDVHKIFNEYNINLKNMYNMDKSGFSIGMINVIYIIIKKQLRIKYHAQLGQQEWVSVVECIYAHGMSIPPLIFQGENLSST